LEYIEEIHAQGVDEAAALHLRSVARKMASLVVTIFWIILAPELVFLAAILAAMIFKVRLMQPAAAGPLGLAVARHDAGFVALAAAFFALACALHKLRSYRKWLGRAAFCLAEVSAATCLLLVVVYLADVLVYRFFLTRLYASDIVTFSRETHAGFTLSRSGLRGFMHHTPWKLAALATGIFLFLQAVVLLFRPIRWNPRGIAAAIFALVLLSVWLYPISDRFYSFDDKPLYENLLERNRDYFEQSNFSDGFRAKVLATQEPVTWVAGTHRRVDVLLVVVESLSAFQSQYFSGIEDWTPQLDDIARHETAMTNFHANGWTTIGGLISLLTGTVPLVPEHTAFNTYGSPRLPDFIDKTPSLPHALEKLGYQTEFIGGGDLDFTGKDTWLKDVGFQKLIGGDDPVYAAQTLRGPFNSVPDRVLYDVALNELNKTRKESPRFVVVETVWTHRPFLDENGNPLSREEPVFRLADAQLGRFYRNLVASHFLDHGLLIIVGDHRGPLPFRQVEFQRFGESAVARIPAVMATRAFPLPHVISQDFQQRDLLASIESLAGDGAWLRPEEGNFLTNPLRPPRCILHARGDDRDLVLVTCGSEEAVVRVAGDKTRFVKGHVADEDLILETINRTRARPPQ
jgi:lipoteichoic acid synthase